jgi:hypothetical protein
MMTEDILQEVYLFTYMQKKRYAPLRGTFRTRILQSAYFIIRSRQGVCAPSPYKSLWF